MVSAGVMPRFRCSLCGLMLAPNPKFHTWRLDTDDAFEGVLDMPRTTANARSEAARRTVADMVVGKLPELPELRLLAIAHWVEDL